MDARRIKAHGLDRKQEHQGMPIPERSNRSTLRGVWELKHCVICGGEFEPRRMGQKTDAPICEAERKRQIRIRKDRKERLKTRRDYINEAQRAFNAYIRQRDSAKACVCCGIALGSGEVGGGFDAGHYRSVGSAPHLRFDERNCHGQRKQCNRYGAGRAVDYRIGLIARIGLAEVESLEADNTPRKWTIEELKQIRDTYKAKLKELKREQ